MSAAFPGQYNTYIPNTAATKGLVVDFSRNPNKFPLAKYTQYISVTKNVGKYIEMTVEEAGRVLNSDGADVEWADGNDAPSGHGHTESFEFKSYVTQRRAFAWALGEIAADQAEWDILAQLSRIHSQRAMTFRTVKVLAKAQNTANYAAAHTATVTSLGTGKHDVSTTARKDIKRSLDYAAEIIRRDTLGAVEPDDLIFVCSPGYARKVAVCQEIVDYIKGSPAAIEELKSGIGPMKQYGLPSTLYGYPVVVEDSYKTTSRKGATAVKTACMSDDKPFMCSRPGGLVGVEGAPSFSTITLFLKEEMTVESMHDKNNRNHKGRITDDFAEILTAPVSGFLFQDAVAV